MVPIILPLTQNKYFYIFIIIVPTITRSRFDHQRESDDIMF